MAQPTLDLSVVIPVFNEEGNLRPLASELRGVLAALERTHEILFVDDGSTDGSLAVLRELARSDRAIRILRHHQNAGQSAALAAGLRAARGAVIVTLDADLQNDPADIPALLSALDHCDVVSGIRQARQDSWVRRCSSRLANRVRNWALDERIHDVGCALKAYRRTFIAEVPLFRGMHRFLPSLAAWNGARVREWPVRHRRRIAGVSKYGIANRLFQVVADLLGVCWLRRRWIVSGNVEELAGREETRSTTPAGRAASAGAGR
jgi:dolichol-phosphate mannosyltransferase